MGGGGGGGLLGSLGNAIGVMLAPVTGGVSLGLGPQTQPANPSKYIPGASQVSAGNITGANAARNAENSLNTSLQNQQAQAAALQQQLLTQPKNITPDNFLSMKNQQLGNLKLGLASTISGIGGVPSPVLSRPSLAAGGPGKTKLGQ